MRTGKIEALLQIPCDKGVNQSTHPRLSPVGTFDTVENMRLNAGVLEKRPGTKAIGSVSTDDLADFATTTQYFPSFITTVGNVGCVGRSDGIVFYHQEVDDSLTANGRFSTCLPVARRSSIMGSDTSTNYGYGQRPTSVAVSSDGYVMAATLDTAGLLYAYIETDEGERLFTRSDTTASHQVKVVASGGGFVLVTRVGTSLHLALYAITSGDVTITTATVSSSLMADSYIDAATSSTGSSWFLIYQLATGDLALREMNGLTTLQTGSNSTVTGGQVPAVSIFSDGTNAWISWAETGGTQMAAYLAANLAAGTIMSAAYGQPTEIPLLYSTSTTANAATFVTRVGGSSFGSVTHFGTVLQAGTQSHVDIRGLVPISSPDDGGRFWAVACWSAEEDTIARIVLVRVSGSTVQIELALDEMPFASDSAFGLDAPDYFSRAIQAGSRFFAAPFVLTLRDTDQLMRVDLLEYTTETSEFHHEVASSIPTAVVSGQPTELYGIPVGMRCIDGSINVDSTARVGSVEIGFPVAPMILAQQAGSSGNLVAGSRGYVAVLEWADAFGRRHQSPPSEEVTVTLAAAGQVQITFPPYTSTALGLTQRFGTMWNIPYLVFYRTVAGGTEYHRLGVSASPSSTSFDDNTADEDLSNEEFVYTAGNVLPNVLAPSCRFMRQAGGRLWCGGLWTADQVECSKLIVPEEQTGFTGHASHRVSTGRPVTGLAVLDDQLVIFAADGIFTVAGEGPNDQGIGSFIVRIVSVGIGCITEKSICETDIGIFFRSRNGFYLLPRGFGAPEYIGAAIRDTLESYTSLAAASWHGNGQHLARFLSDHVGNQSTVVFTFDINTGQWFVDTFSSSFDTQYPAELGIWPEGFVMCGPIQSTLTYPSVWIEDPDQVADAWSFSPSLAGLHITQRLRTNWINPAGPLGMNEFKQTIIAMLPTNAASITGLVETDGTGNPHTNTWSISASSDVAYRYLVQPVRGGVGFRVTLSDGTVSGSPSGGVKFLAIALESEPNDGIRLPDSGEMA